MSESNSGGSSTPPESGTETRSQSEKGTDGDSETPTDTGKRTVTVPLEVYKSVTVFSTLVATILVVLGFTMFDAAIFESSIIRQFVLALLDGVGLVPSDRVLSTAFALFGLVLIASGAVIYIIGARFRASEMVEAE